MAKKDTHDVNLLTLDESLQAPLIVNNLQSKGFCKIKAEVSSEDLEQALRESTKLQDEGRFFTPSILLPEALMGVTGSFRVAKLHRVDAPDPKYSADGEHLQNLDEVLTDMAMIIEPYFETLGFSSSGRTVGMLHEGTSKSQQEAIRDMSNAQIQMTEAEAPKWLVDLVRGKILCVISLGPTAGTMQLQPFSDADEFIEVPTDPGDVFLIRQDALIHRHMSKGNCMLMSCLFLSDKTISSKHTLTKELQVNLSPPTKALVAWVEDRMKKLKSQEMDEKEELPADLPPEWHRAMNAAYSTGQRIAVASTSVRMPQLWDSSRVYSLCNTGTDCITEIPLLRWDYTRVYDPDPDCWKQYKTNQRHGGFMDGAALFDQKSFNLSPAEAGGMDPMQRHTLEVGYEAAAKAGYTRKKLLNSFGGVYVSQEGQNEWGPCEKSDCGGSATGGATSITCGRVSFCFGMKGPCMTFSMEEAGSHLTSYMAFQCVSERGRYQVPPYAMFGGGQILLWSLASMTLQSTGHLSAIGRCRSYDNYADGYTRSDLVGYGICKRHVEIVDGEAVVKEDALNPLGVFVGGFGNHMGTSATFGAPSGSAIVEVLHNAIRTALIEPSDIDCASCHASGHFLSDAVEGRVYNRIFRQGGEAPFFLGASKSNMGNSVDGAGMASLTKILWEMKYGTVNPNLHLLELNPNMDPDCPSVPMSEAVSLQTRVTHQSDLGIAYNGMQVGLVYQGQMEDVNGNDEPTRRDPLAFWPAAGGELDAALKPRRGYHVCGSMTKWEPVQMKESLTRKDATSTQKAEAKEYAYTFTLGENRWEDFQVWLDGDRQKILIPGEAGAVAGPEDGGDGDTASLGTWVIDGRPTYKLAIAEGDEDGEETFKEVETPDTALIGTQFKVILKAAGRYLQVSWEKVPLDDKALAAIENAPAKGSTAEYFVAGSWAKMQLQKMEKDKNEPGLFHFSTPLTWTGGRHHNFLIVRNKDWSQAIYPDHEEASEEAEIYGPDEDIGHRWYFDDGGRPSDIVISFQRTTEAGLDVKKVSWKFSPQAAISE